MVLRALLAASILSISTLAGAHAATLYDAPGSTGVLPTDTGFTVNFLAGAGPGALSFGLDGYATLDGQNFFEDDFVLSLNGLNIFSGTFDLGGGGADVVFFQPTGTTLAKSGQHVSISAPLNFLAGANSLTFAYKSLPGPDHAGFQGTGDEGWGVTGINVTGAAPIAGVPEPATWGLMILGFGAAGTMLRRRRGQARLTA